MLSDRDEYLSELGQVFRRCKAGDFGEGAMHILVDLIEAVLVDLEIGRGTKLGELLTRGEHKTSMSIYFVFRSHLLQRCAVSFHLENLCRLLPQWAEKFSPRHPQCSSVR